VIEYPNLSLEPSVEYRPVADIDSVSDLEDRLTADGGSADEGPLVLVWRSVKNAYGSTYRVLGEDGNNPAAHDYLGMVQLLNKNYWSGRYYCSRASYLGRERDQLHRVIDRLERLSTQGGSPSEDPTSVYPIDVPSPSNRDDILEAFERLRMVEEDAESSVDDRLRLADQNSSMLYCVFSSRNSSSTSHRHR